MHQADRLSSPSESVAWVMAPVPGAPQRVVLPRADVSAGRILTGTVLEAVVMKCKKKSEMLWVLATIEDLLLCGEASNAQFSSRSLKGARTGGGSRWLMDEWLAKRSILDWVLADAGTTDCPLTRACPCRRSSHPMPMFGRSS